MGNGGEDGKEANGESLTSLYFPGCVDVFLSDGPLQSKLIAQAH